ncbi:MAG TPA: acyloxyacyl hydrolase [Clostridia bacterium]|nr:acyloxyacyl hydrolase [Clostridia bacterium]
MNTRSLLFSFAVVVCLTGNLVAQSEAPARQPGWNFGVFAGGGARVADHPPVRIVNAGVRVGHVMSREHSRGIMRGTFELGGEVVPVYSFFTQGRTFYGAAITPVLLKWNFTAHRRVVPFFEVFGSGIFTREDFPAGDTSTVNFGSGAGVGAHISTRSRQAVSFNLRATHISNASIGNYNPGINAALVATVGYTWFK